MGRKKKEEMIICKHCGAKIEKKSKYCTECGTKLSSNMVLFFLVMIPLFLCVFLTANMSSIVYSVISSFKYGQDFLVETILAFVVLIVTLASGNSYIFTQKKENIVKSIIAGWPMLLIAFVNLLSSIISLSLSGGINIFNIFNLILFCCSIGVYEEFLCRGWLFNEFIERFGHTKKQVVWSIILSSIIFGAIHFVNFFTTDQGLIVTIAQIVQASAIGTFLASLYYKNKNIWSVIFLHAFYDFAILLGSSNLVKDCTTGTISSGMTTYLAISSFLISLMFIIATIGNLRKSERWNNLPSKNDNKKEKKYSTHLLVNVAIVVVFIVLLLYNPSKIEGYEDYQVCYNYEEIIINNYRITELRIEKYDIKTSKILTVTPEKNDTTNVVPITKTEHYHLSVYEDIENGGIIVENINTGDKVNLNKGDLISDLVVYEASSYYAITYYIDHVGGSTAYYLKINKSSLDNTKEYLDTLNSKIIKIELPTMYGLGYLEDTNNNQKYIYLYSNIGDKFVIDQDGNVYIMAY